MGRPPKLDEDKFVLIHVRVPPGIIKRIDAYRGARADAPDRSAVIREILAAGIEAKKID